MTLVVLNGPNLNMLGARDPQIYGAHTLKDVEALCQERAQAHGLALDFYQSNHEGALVDKIQASRGAVGLVINAGALSHTSIAIHDALELVEAPIIEVHISQVYRRETFRHKSYVSAVATGLIVGLGIAGYGHAIDAIAAHIAQA